MSAIKELFLQTQALFELANQPFPKDDEEREQLIAKLDQGLEEREGLITKIDAATLSEPEKRLGQELVKLNKRFNERMEQIRAEIRANISEVKMKKVQARKYENPYEGPTSDGIFFDKRGV
jgi:flagellar protein FliT